MGLGLESRFERYCSAIVETMGHADRAQPARWYLKGLLLAGERKSVEPMAARVQPHNVRSAHQSMHHLVAAAQWSDSALLSAVVGQVLARLIKHNEPCVWIVDDTGFAKKGRHSVGVAHQYCGQHGKTENCGVAVSLSLATARASLPVGFQLYLPREWTADAKRCRKAGVPANIGFATKGQIAWQHIEAGLQAGYPRGTVLADAAYGDETAWRERLSAQGLHYAVGIRSSDTLWWGTHQPAAMPALAGRGRPRRRVQRDAEHQPISAAALARELPASHYRTLSWREGSNAPLRSRFARVRVRPAHRDQPRPEQWLIIEWPPGEPAPTHYWLSNLPASIGWAELIDTLKARWRIERDYQELKQELGLGHYEGRNWTGFHHHASLCIAAYGFLMLERLSGSKKNPAQFKAPALPEAFRPRGARTHAASPAVLHRHWPLPLGTSSRQKPSPVPLLREKNRRATRSLLLTQ
jgi:SRSO17 transposase